MSNKLISVVGISLAALVLLAVGAFGFALSSDKTSTGIVSQQNVGIWVTGSGEVTVVPDIAVLNLGVYVQMDTLEAAQAQAAESMAAIMAVLESYNIDEKDIQTSNYNVSPMWSWDKDGNRYLDGYYVSNTVTVKVRNTDDTGSIIDDVVAAGGEYTIINGISFTVDDTEAYYTQARAKAIANAIAKATQIAELTGVTLGDPNYIVDNNSNYGPIYYYPAYDTSARAEGGAPTSISTGEVKISTSIQIVFDIE
ncbi:MAG: SIMPL domain-containing protein [Dehalococcoidales bacterium]|nr:SIMPL domain-containing protein [Dehalococcoidales bacterium]